MLETDRHNKILELLRSDQDTSVQKMARALYVSEATIRRDLRHLDQQGFVKRVYGGAVLVKNASQDVPRHIRSQQQQGAKRVIAEQAAAMISDGMAVFLDASTTAQHICEFLRGKKGLTVITNGLRTAETLGMMGITTYTTGGRLLYNALAYVGSYAENMLCGFHADMLFFSSTGISMDGQITDRSAEEVGVLRLMLRQSRQKFYLCDNSKVGGTYCYHVCTLDDVDGILSDAVLPMELRLLRRPDLSELYEAE